MAPRQRLDALSASALLARIQPTLDELIATHAAGARRSARTRDEQPSLLLTGATGFLGVHVLARLAQSRAFGEVVVVVRDASKLTRQFARYQIGCAPLDRLRIIEGDLATIPLDLLPDTDIVLHGAAAIHCLSPLGKLWKDNVETTLRICQRYAGTASRVVFVSSLSVFVSSDLHGEHAPRPLPVSENFHLIGGYAQSKFLGEKLVEAIGGDIIRPGLLTGSSFSGLFPEQDFFTLFMRTVVQLGVYPKDYTQAFVDVTPVDYAASQVVSFLLFATEGSISHIANKRSVSLSEMLRLLPVRAVPREDFNRALQTLPRLTQMLLSYAFFKHEALQQYPHYFNVDLFQSTNHSYSVNTPFELDNGSLLARYLPNLSLDTLNDATQTTL
jgi:thioester reductase-like protein